MRKLFTFLVAVLLTASVLAQSPEKMSYQAVIRNSSNALVSNTSIGMQISILQGSASGTVVYVETQEPSTNTNGLVSIEIGTGTIESGDFTTIDWANGLFFIKTETDPTGGTNYTITGTSQLLSVPYALHAKTAETVTGGITETDPTYTSSQAANITVTDITKLSNLSGVNTGDQDITGIATNATAITAIETAQTTQNTAIALNTAKTGITTAQANAIVANTGKDTTGTYHANRTALDAVTGTNTGDQDLSALATKTALGDSTAQVRSEIPDVSGFLTSETDPTYTSSQAANITVTDITNLGNLSGTNTGDQDLSALATKTALGDSTAQVRSEIPDVSGFLTSETDPTFNSSIASGITATDTANWNAASIGAFIELDPTFTGSQAANITATDITNLGNLSGTNTGDQDITGIATNATAITAIETEQTTQNSAIALNTAKTGISTAQADAIVANTGKDTTGIYHANRTALNAVSGVNTGDQDLSALATKTALKDSIALVRTEIPNASQWTTSGSDIYYNSGKVGIGTTTPGEKLTVKGTGSDAVGVVGIDVSGTGAGDGGFIWASSAIAPNLAVNSQAIHMIGQDKSQNNSGYIGFNYKGGESLSNFLTFGFYQNDNLLNLTAAGNVGIGTTSPLAKLHLVASDNNGLEFAPTYNGGTRILAYNRNSTAYLPMNLDASYIAMHTGSSAERMRIDADGNVGIGTITPENKFVVGGLGWAQFHSNSAGQNPSTSNNYGVYIGSNRSGGAAEGNIAYHDYLTFAEWDGTTETYSERMRIDGNGNVGIGTTTTSHPLQMASGAHVTSAGVWSNASDARLKTNVVNTSYGLQTVMQLRPVNYTMIKGGEAQVGFIAQEVQKIVPEVVSGIEGDIEKSETLGLSYGNLVPVLTKAIQEQQETIENQQKQIDELKKLVESLLNK